MNSKIYLKKLGFALVTLLAAQSLLAQLNIPEVDTVDILYDNKQQASYLQGAPIFSKFGESSQPLQFKLSRDFNAAYSFLKTDSVGNVTKYTYNMVGDVLSEQNAVGELTTYAYDYAKNTVTITDPVGAVQVQRSDDLGRVIQVKILDKDGNVQQVSTRTYDADGYTEYSEQGEDTDNLTQSTYNQKGQLLLRLITTGQEDRTVETNKYDANGNLIEHTDDQQHTTTYEYDQHDQLVRQSLGNGEYITYEYDLAGNRIKTCLPRGVTLVENYDSASGKKMGQQLYTQDNAGRKYVYYYDEYARLMTSEDPRGISFEYSYNDQHQLSKVQASSGETISYEYDAQGRIHTLEKTSAQRQCTRIQKHYDQLDRLVQEHIYIDGQLHQEAKQSWEVSERTRLELANGQGQALALEYAYSATKHLTQVRAPQYDYALEFGYTEAGWLDNYSDGQLEWIRSADNELIQIPKVAKTLLNEQVILGEATVVAGEGVLKEHWLNKLGQSSLIQRAYSYSKTGRLLQEAHTQMDEQGNLISTDAQSLYRYDKLGVLQKKFNKQGDLQKLYAVYQQYGNQVNVESITQDEQQLPSKEQLEQALQAEQAQECLPLRVSDGICEYDESGNVTQVTAANGQVTNYSWNAWGELERVEVVGQSVWEALYDGQGRRLQVIYQEQDKPAQTTVSYYDPQVEFLEVGVQTNNQLAWKIYGVDLNGGFASLQGIGGLRAIIDVTTNQILRTIQDIQGHILGYVKDSEVIWKQDSYNAYGPTDAASTDDVESSTLAEQLIQKHSWRSKQADATGLIWMGTRYYNPTTTRLLSPDPYGHQGSIDLYSYANGNPIKYADPDGRYASPVYEVEKTWVKKHLSTVQTGLDFAGMLPGVGAVFDVANAAIHLAQGNFVDAGLSMASAVPGIGDAVAAAKIVGKGTGLIAVMGTVAKGGDTVINAGKISKIDRGVFKVEREAFWKAEVKNNPSKYSLDDIKRMQLGRAPTGPDGYPVELHHVNRTPQGSLIPMSRTDHRLGKNYKKNHP